MDQEDRARAAMAGLLAGGEDESPALALVFAEALSEGFTRKALEQLAREPLVVRAAAGPAALCLASAVPVGLLHAERLRGITEDAGAACRLLHGDPRCVAACRALAMAVALAVKGQPERIVEQASLVASPSPVVREAVEGAQRGEPGSAERAIWAAFAALRHETPATVHPLSVAAAGALLGASRGMAALPFADPASSLADAASRLISMARGQ